MVPLAMLSPWAIALVVDYVLVPFVIVSVLRRGREPMAMLAWILFIVLVPYVGIILYWLMGSGRVVYRTRRRRRRVAHLVARLERWARQRAEAGEAALDPQLPEDLRGVARLGERLSGMPATGGNLVEVYQEANRTYAALEAAIRAAQRHVHLEYYIWQPDETGRMFRELLIEKARAGVRCRLLLDAVGCWRLGRRFIRPLTEAGVQVAFFLPLRPFRRRLSLHMRNHRKIAVIDGEVAFAGSQNIGDEYRGRLKRLSPWYDTHMRVRGPAALFLQRTFAEDWLFATREKIDSEDVFPAPARAGSSVVQILPTGPEESVSPLEQVLFAAVSSARASIRVATPYFVPGGALRMALIHACSRGVRVKVVLPTRTDAPITLWAARSFYAELLDAGAEVYEYDAGVLHSKIVTVDNRWCMVGSANMDVRSFRLNFEVTALIYDPQVTRELSASVDGFCQRARTITPRYVWRRPLRQQLLQGAARLLTPLL